MWLLRQPPTLVPDLEGVRGEIHCGCCPFDHCPNIRPAFETLRSMGFQHLRALLLPNNFAKDGVGQGYAIERGSEREIETSAKVELEAELSDAIGPACGCCISPHDDNRIMNCGVQSPKCTGEADESTPLNVSFFAFAMTSSRSFGATTSKAEVLSLCELRRGRFC